MSAGADGSAEEPPAREAGCAPGLLVGGASGDARLALPAVAAVPASVDRSIGRGGVGSASSACAGVSSVAGASWSGGVAAAGGGGGGGGGGGVLGARSLWEGSVSASPPPSCCGRPSAPVVATASIVGRRSVVGISGYCGLGRRGDEPADAGALLTAASWSAACQPGGSLPLAPTAAVPAAFCSTGCSAAGSKGANTKGGGPTAIGGSTSEVASPAGSSPAAPSGFEGGVWGAAGVRAESAGKGTGPAPTAASAPLDAGGMGAPPSVTTSPATAAAAPSRIGFWRGGAAGARTAGGGGAGAPPLAEAPSAFGDACEALSSEKDAHRDATSPSVAGCLPAAPGAVVSSSSTNACTSPPDVVDDEESGSPPPPSPPAGDVADRRPVPAAPAAPPPTSSDGRAGLRCADPAPLPPPPPPPLPLLLVVAPVVAPPVMDVRLNADRSAPGPLAVVAGVRNRDATGIVSRRSAGGSRIFTGGATGLRPTLPCVPSRLRRAMA